jgi:hypothetical protein
LRQFHAAKLDLERYLVLSDPTAPDRTDVEQRLRALRDWLATLN